MAADNDDDRTVFGQKLPPQAPRPSQAPGQAQGQAPGQPPPAQGQGEGDRTVFGMRVPPQQPAPPPQAPYPPQQPPAHPPAGQQPYPQPPYPPAQPPQGGYPQPPYPQPPQPPAYGQQPPYGQPPQQPYPAPQPPARGGDDTWFGGRVPGSAPSPQVPPHQAPPSLGQPSYPQPPYAPPPQGQFPPSNSGWTQSPQGYPAPSYPQQPPAPGYPNWSSGAQHVDPQFPSAQRPQAAPRAPSAPRIAFNDALRGAGLDIGTSSNPIIAAASDLLILLGRLRTGMVEMQAIPLRDHVVREINSFVQKAQAAGIAPEDIEVARYALAATADDIVQTVPGSDPGYWAQFSMAAELLNDRSAGIGFFARLDQVIGLAHQRRHVLELMFVCLSLGFEGKYRTEPNGAVALTRLRNEVYQRLRAATPRPGQDVSVRWTPVILGGRRRSSVLPMWIVGGVAAAMVLALFATLSWVLSTEAQAAQGKILALHNPADRPIIQATGEVKRTEYEAEAPAQLDRIKGQLSEEIADGRLNVEIKGDYIAIRVGPVLRFKSGSADLSEDFSAMAKVIAAVLESEPGEIVVEGHSDNIPLRGTGRYKTNEALSEARAGTVRDLLVQTLSDPSRATIVGVGPNQPLDTDNTPEARAKNRRVEILLRQEQKQ